MFGRSDKTQPTSDSLTVQVHVVGSAEAFALAQKIWGENGRMLRTDQTGRKEFLHFGYADPPCVVWLQRDPARTDTLELIVRWEADYTHEVYVLTAAPVAGDDSRAKALLNSMLTTPSIVPADTPVK